MVFAFADDGMLGIAADLAFAALAQFLGNSRFRFDLCAGCGFAFSLGAGEFGDRTASRAVTG